MSTSRDLTRWNRAGLTRFRYVDGNAVDFLERLRHDLAGHFSAWTDVQPPPNETAAQRDARLLAQYDTPRDEWGWEIVRAFARACHVLGEHVDAYANEGYLRTATQWDSVRKLVSLLDVHPAPPASASTPLVIDAKEEPGTIAAGFAVRYTPKTGGAPVTFETLEDVAVDAALNAIRLDGWNLSPAPLVETPAVRPLPAIGARSARAIQGVGSRYQTLLDGHPPERTSTFLIRDFRDLDPSVLQRGRLRMWEAKSKAEILLDFPWTSSELGVLADSTLPEILARTAAQLATTTARDAAEMTRLLEYLRAVQMALDEDVFSTILLQELLSPGAPPPEPPPLWEAPEKSGISAGQLALVTRTAEQTEEAAVVRVARVEPSNRGITLDPVAHQPAWEEWTRGVASLLAKPKIIAVAHLTGSPSSVTFSAPHGLVGGDFVAWQTGGTWMFSGVEKADELGLLLAGTAQPAVGTEVLRAIEVVKTALSSGERVPLPLGYRAAAKPAGSGFQLLTDAERQDERDANGALRFFSLKDATIQRAVYIPATSTAAGRVSEVTGSEGDGRFRFGGKRGDLESGQWIIGDDAGRLLALRIRQIEELEDHFAVTFESVVDPEPEVASLDVSILMGVGPVIRDRLIKDHTVTTVGELAASPATIGGRELLELRAKAQLVTTFPFEERDLRPILEWPVTDVFQKPRSAVAAKLGKPPEWLAGLLEKTRQLQAVIDEEPLATLKVQDLLPLGAPTPVQGYELKRLDRIYGVFEHTIRPAGWDVNETAVSGAQVRLDEDVPLLLTRGRRVIVERPGLAREATVNAVEPVARTVDLLPPLKPEEGFTLGNLVIRANVVRAGHGEGKPAKVLGSGDAARRSQSFILQEKNVAFVSDPTQPSGVAAAVQVIVAGQTWQQVATLRDSKPSDPHYEVRLTEDEYLAFTFGDGQRGRRLPTGTNNVRVAFRTGTGLAGNLAPGSLVKAARPHPRVAAVSQPLDATGGNDREDVDSLKTQAPRSVLTLERAVSLTDFAALAARQASVWQARAFALPTGGGRQASVEVVVVPAGGGPLGPLATDLQLFLATNAVPGIDLKVSRYVSKPFDLAVEIEVKGAEYDHAEVRKAVETALFDAFGLRRRTLGASLFISEVYAVIEAVTGVESSTVTVKSGGQIQERVLPASSREAVFLDPLQSRVAIAVKEFEL